MRINPVQINSCRNNKSSRSFRAIEMNDNFKKHYGINDEKAAEIKRDWGIEFEAKYPGIDCFLNRYENGVFIKNPSTEITFSERKLNGEPNNPNKGLDESVLTQQEKRRIDYYEEDHSGKQVGVYDFRKNTNASENLYCTINSGFNTIKRRQNLREEVLEKDPHLEGRELVEAVEEYEIEKNKAILEAHGYKSLF